MTVKSGALIGIFFFLELVFLVFMYLSTFYDPLRVEVTGKSVNSREEALSKGYGYYSDPEYGPCFSESGNCDTNGYRFLTWRCIPNMTSLGDGNGCMTDSGLMTYNMIMEEEPCQQQCYDTQISLKENVVTNDDSNVITSVGTHNLIQRISGLDMSDSFIGEFNMDEMAYELKRCIPTGNGNVATDRDFIGYQKNEYTCIPGSAQGIDGCTYMCGSDPTLNFNEGFSRSTDQILSMIPYPWYESNDGEKVFYCNDLLNNNRVQILNNQETVPSSFIFPQICYDHANIFLPPNPQLTHTQNGGKYWKNDAYLYLDLTSQQLEEYFELDYNILSNPHSYVRLTVDNEIRLLARYHSGRNGINSLTDTSAVNVAYIPYPKDQYTSSQLIGNAQFINIMGPATYEDIPIYKEINGENVVIEGGSYIYTPFDIVGGMMKNEEKFDGKYVFDDFTGSLELWSNSFSTNTTYYLLFHYEGEGFFPALQEVSIDSNRKGSITLEQEDTFPPYPEGNFSFYRIPFGDYKIVTTGIDGNDFPIKLDRFPVTGNLFVSTFIEDTNIQNYLLKDVDPEACFYIFGSSVAGFPGNSQEGFYYPLYLSQKNGVSYSQIRFVSYPDTLFYIPKEGSYIASKTLTSNIPSYDFLRGRAIIKTKYYAGIVSDTEGSNFWFNPEVIAIGNDYNEDTYYRLKGRNLFTKPMSLRGDVSILETARNGIDKYKNVRFIDILDGQIRSKTTNGYEITIFPQKMLQKTRDFTNFGGPYLGDKEKFICLDKTNTPVADGTIVNFSLGEKITALVQNNKFNTVTDSSCGKVLVKGGKSCLIERDPINFDLSKNCITFNPSNDYIPVDSFIEFGYIIDDENELFCYDDDGNKTVDKRCTKPFLTDYLVEDKIYDVNEELIVNRGNTRLYLSLANGNTALPGYGDWVTVSELEEIFFNVGQYLGRNIVYKSISSGQIYLPPGWAIEPFSYLKYRTDQQYEDGNEYVEDKFNEFLNRGNLISPYLPNPISEDETLTYSLVNQDLTSPVFQVTMKGLTPGNKVFLNESYLNGLLWFMGATNFLSLTVGGSLSDLQYIYFSQVTTDGTNTLQNFNNNSPGGSTQLELSGDSTDRPDLTGYYCYFIPLTPINNSNLPEAIFGREWAYYIYYLMNGNTNTPFQFEVVYIESTNEDITHLNFRRNITSIPEGNLFSFIDPDLDVIDGVFGLFLPFSESGPLPRIHDIDADGNFQINLDIPEEYGGFVSQLGSGGNVPIYKPDSQTQTFFNYGFTGFSVTPTITNPSYEGLVEYDRDISRINSMVYIKKIRVTSEDSVYVSEVKINEDDPLTFSVGDIVSFAGHRFEISALNPRILVGNYDYEHFDYRCSPLEDDFLAEYRDDKYFKSYISIETDFILPSRYIGNGLDVFVLSQNFNFTNNLTNIEYSSLDNPDIISGSGTFDNNSEDFIFFSDGLNDNQNRYLNVINNDKAELMKLSELKLTSDTTINVTKITGKPPGKLSLSNYSTIYSDLLKGESFIADFTVDGIGNLVTGLKYNRNGYNFGIPEGDEGLASVSLFRKSYTDPERYRDTNRFYVENDLFYFKDYRTKLVFRNEGDTPQKYNDEWTGNGSIHPQVDYKLYHDDQIYEKDDLVKYDDKIWKTLTNVGLPSPNDVRNPPNIYENEIWKLESPTGDLFSSANFYMAALGDLDFSNPSVEEFTVDSYGNTHVFPKKKFYFNRKYRMDFSNAKLVYFSSDGAILSDEYNYIEGNYIAHISYLFDDIKVPRSTYISEYSNNDNRKIEFVVKRSNDSLLAIDGILDKSEVQFGTDSSTDGGSLFFHNNNDDLSRELLIQNDLDNQNIPIRLANYGEFGNCLRPCVKNIVEDAFTTSSFAYIDLIKSGLVDTWFKNQIFSYNATDQKSFISLPSQPCREKIKIGDRYLTNCFSEIPDAANVNLSDYLYRIPTLTPAQYGVPFCTTEADFLFSNSLFLYFVPMAIDSQNFLKFEFVSREDDGQSGVINAIDYFKYEFSGGVENISAASQIVRNNADDTYYTSAQNEALVLDLDTDKRTFISEGNFSKEIFKKKTIELKDGDNSLILIPKRIGFRMKTVSFEDQDMANYDYCWGTSSNSSEVWFHGFIFSKGLFSSRSLIKLGENINYSTPLPKEPKLNVWSSTQNKVITQDVEFEDSPYWIEDYQLIKGEIFDVNTTTLFSYGGVTVHAYINNDYLYQPGDYDWTAADSAFSVGDNLYYKYRDDECLCKVYANYGGSNGFLSYLDGNMINDLSGNPHIPIFFNMNKEGILQPPRTKVTILKGNGSIESDRYIETFAIKNGELTVNPISKPFNLTSKSSFSPGVLGEDFGIVSSTTSSNLYTTPLSDFTLLKETETEVFFANLNGEEVLPAQDNASLIQRLKRINQRRPNYPDSKYECNIVLQSTILANVQATYDIVKGKPKEKNTVFDTITIKANNILELKQNSKPRTALTFKVDGSVISNEKTSYANDQFLTVQYLFDDTYVDKNTYMSRINEASEVTVSIIYETKLESDTAPVKTEIDVSSFTIIIEDNS